MSQRNKFVGTPALIFSTAILLLSLGWIGNVVFDNWVSVHKANAAYQQNAENDRRQSAIEIANTCFNRPIDDFRECVGDNLETHYRDQATNEDLQAQQDMAFWAFWLLATSVIGIFISGAGVFLLVRSIGLGRNANIQATRAAIAATEANAIMQEERRPWVTLIRDLGCEFYDRDGYGGTLSWNYNFINKGKTPAYSVRVSIKFFRGNDGFGCLREVESFTDKCVGEQYSGGTAILFPDEKTDFLRYRSYFSRTYEIGSDERGHVAPLTKSGDKYSALVCITYRTGVSPDAPVGVETSAFSIESDEVAIGPWRHKMLEFASSRIVR